MNWQRFFYGIYNFYTRSLSNKNSNNNVTNPTTLMKLCTAFYNYGYTIFILPMIQSYPSNCIHCDTILFHLPRNRYKTPSTAYYHLNSTQFTTIPRQISNQLEPTPLAQRSIRSPRGL